MRTSSYSRSLGSRAWVAGWVAALGLLASRPLDAGQVRPVGLEEMARRAERIFSGRCVGTRVEPDPQLGLDVTQVTFAVDRAIKGVAGRTLTVRVLGASVAPGATGREGFDALRFAPGERVVLFLYADSALGLTSPVGLGQGKFSVFKDKTGRDMAVNALGNRNLLGGRASESRARLHGALAQWDGESGLSPNTLLDGARDLLAFEETTSPGRDVRRSGRGGRR